MIFVETTEPFLLRLLKPEKINVLIFAWSDQRHLETWMDSERSIRMWVMTYLTSIQKLLVECEVKS